MRRRPAFAAAAADVLEARQLLSGTTTAAVDLTAHEQYFLELVNRARQDPAAEAARLGTPLNTGLAAGTLNTREKQVLASHQILTDASRLHSDDMLERDYFSHTTPDGLSPTDRAKNAGYDGNAGENLAFRASSPTLDRSSIVDQLHQDLWESPVHRVGMMIDDDRAREIGLGLSDGIYTTTSNRTGELVDFDAAFITHKFGVSNGGRIYFTGVVYDDAGSGDGNDDFYSIGEAVGGGRVVARNVATGDESVGMVGAAGGYNVQVTAGTYEVWLEQNGETYAAGTHTVGDWNVKLDFDHDEIVAAPPSDPTFLGDAVIRVDDGQVRWSFFHDGSWYDAEYAIGSPSVDSVQTGDFDGDGDLDVLMLREDARWDLLQIDGRDATFTTGVLRLTGGLFEQFHAGDFDGDGRADLAVYDTSAGEWQVSLTETDGSFRALSNWQTLGRDRSWVNSRVGDFNGDGRADIAIQENTYGKWYFMQSTGSAFATASWGDAVNINIQYAAIETGDVNGDGRDELLQLNSETGYWLVGFVNDEATFETWARWTTEAAWTNVLVGDFDGDGRADIAAQTGTPTGNRDGVWYVATSELNANVTPAQVRGRFVGQKWSNRWNPAWGVTNYGAADLDGDGRTDLLGRPADSGTFLIGRSTGASSVDGGAGFDFGSLAGLLGDRDEVDFLLTGESKNPITPLLPADA